MAELPVIDMWVVEVPDARGERRRLKFLGGWVGWRQFPTEVPRQVRRAIQKETLRGTKLAAMVAGACLGLSAGCLSGVSRAIVPDSSPFWLRLVVMFALIPVLWLLFDLIFLRWFRVRYRVSYVRASLRHGRCPFCMYDLSGTPAAADTIVCSECRGVWSKPSAVEASSLQPVGGTSTS